MMRYLRMTAAAIALCAVAGSVVPDADGATIDTVIKLNLAGASPDVHFDGDDFYTLDDGNNATLGDQDTAVVFDYFLDSVMADILTPTASFTLQGLTKSGQALVFGGGLVLQQFTGGEFWLYGESNELLLSGDLADSALSGSIGVSTGGLFTTSFSDVTGGILAPYFLANTVTLAMNLSGIVTVPGSATGLSVTITDTSPMFFDLGDLHGFNANAQVGIDAAPIPEPASIALLAIGFAIASRLFGRQRRSRC